MALARTRQLKIGLACGGTGGHIFPGIATGDVLEARGHDVNYWLAGKDVEQSAVGARMENSITIRSRGFEGGAKKAPITLYHLHRAYRQSRKAMAQQRPDVLLAMGSYACAGPVAAALKLDVPVVLHEANVVPGRAISWFAGKATNVAASFEETRHFLRKADLTLTGLPLRKAIVEGFHQGRGWEGARAGKPFRILVMGGSRGARAVNLIAGRAIRDLHDKGHLIEVTHLTGVADEEDVRKRYERAGVPHKVASFVGDMSEIYARTDLAICRAGAATCAELSVYGVPALLVPYPFAARDHQTANAEALERLSAADMVQEKHLETDWLADYVIGCMHSPQRLARLSTNLKKRSRVDAAERLADLVERAATGDR